MRMKKLIIGVVTVSLTLILGARQTDLIQKRFEIDPAKQVVINYIGIDEDVFIEKHDKNEILLKFEKEMKGSKSKRNIEYFEKILPEIDFNNNTLDIEVKYPRWRFNFFRYLSGFRVRVISRLFVPANTDVKIKVVDGDIDVSDLNGNIELRSVDGDLKVNECNGPMKLRTTDGNMDVKSSRGSIRMKTVDGDVTASGVFNDICFKSVDGDGKFTLRKGSVLTEDCILQTVDGDIRLIFYKDFTFKLNVKSDDGKIDFENIDFKRVIMKKRNRFEAERGDAQFTIEIRTIDGDISIEEL